jgi:hypothetical protein
MVSCLDGCNGQPWMSAKLGKKILALTKRIAERQRMIAESLPDDVPARIRKLEYHGVELDVAALPSAILFNLKPHRSKTGRAYFGIMPRPEPTPLPSMSSKVKTTHPFTHPIVTTNLSKLGRRRLYSLVRAEANWMVQRLEAEEVRLWELIKPHLNPPTSTIT